MNLMIGQRLACFVLLALVTPSEARTVKLPAHAAPNPIVSQQREVATIAGHKIRILVGLEVNSDCSLGGATAIKVVAEPMHGDAVQSHEDVLPGFLPPNPRQKCNATKLPGTVLYYTPNQSFSGHDHVEALVSFSTGKLEDDNIEIDVR